MKKLAISVAIIISSAAYAFSQVSSECSEYFKMSEDKFEGVIILKSKPVKLSNKLGESVTLTWKHVLILDKDVHDNFIVVKFTNWTCPSKQSRLYMLTKDGRRLQFTAESTNCNGEANFKIDGPGDLFIAAILQDNATDLAVSGPNTRYIFTQFEPLKKNIRLFGECLIEYWNNTQ